MDTYLDVPDEKRGQVVSLLDGALAAALQLYLLAKMAHWNVKGQDFAGLHALFEDIADHLRRHADTLAERAATLGGYIDADAVTIVERAQIETFEEPVRDGMTLADELAARLAAYARELRGILEKLTGDLADPGTEHVIAGILVATERDVWMLESHLQEEEDEEIEGVEGEEPESPPPA